MPLSSRLTLLVVLAFSALCVSAAENPRLYVKDIGQDHFVSGDNVTVDNAVAGDLFAVGGRVDLTSSVSGDTFAAGREVTLRGTAQHNVFLAGGNVSVAGQVEHNLRAAGRSVTLQPGARIAGSASIAGSEVNILGDVTGYLMASAKRLYINGAVDGDVRVAGGEIELGPHARVTGKLLYASRSGLKRDPQAQVLGAVEQVQMPEGRRSHVVGAGHWIWYAGLDVIAVVWLVLLPGASGRCSEIFKSQWGWSLLTGFLVFILAPVVLMLCLITVIGIPAALIVFLMMPVLLILGYASGAIAIGDVLRERFKPQQIDRAARIKFVLMAILLLAFLTAIPFFGGLITIIVLFIGLGALLRTARDTLRTTPMPA